MQPDTSGDATRGDPTPAAAPAPSRRLAVPAVLVLALAAALFAAVREPRAPSCVWVDDAGALWTGEGTLAASPVAPDTRVGSPGGVPPGDAMTLDLTPPRSAAARLLARLRGAGPRPTFVYAWVGTAQVDGRPAREFRALADVTVTVIDDRTGAPVAGASVETAGPPAETVRTDAHGTARLGQLAGRPIRIRVVADGRAIREATLTPRPGSGNAAEVRLGPTISP